MPSLRCDYDECVIEEGHMYVQPIPKGYVHRFPNLPKNGRMHAIHLSSSDLLRSNIEKLKNEPVE